MWSSSREKGTHEMNRTRVCLLCLKKPKTFHKIQGSIFTRIKSFYEEYDPTNMKFPSVVCDPCRRKIYDASLNKKAINFPDPALWDEEFDFDDGSCGCKLCEIVKSRLSNFSVQRKKSKVSKQYKKYCSKCLLAIGKGIRHKCNLKTMTNNVQKILRSNSKPSVTELVTSKLLKSIFNEQSVRPNDEVKLKQVSSKPIKITYQPKTNPAPGPISVYDMRNLQTTLNLSANQTLTAAKVLSNGSRKKVEKNLRKRINTLGHVLDDHFESSSFEFVTETAGKEPKKNVQEAIFCKDLSKFIEFVVQVRNIRDYHLKFGLDGGGKFLKLCLSIQETSPSVDSEKVKGFKDSGVKKLFIIGIAESAQENYHNVKLLWDKLNMNKFLSQQMDGTVTTDLKLANILCGLMSHTVSYPCTWCVAAKAKLAFDGELRTISSCQQNFENYRANKKVKKDAKNYYNCVDAPIIKSDKTSILYVLPPPELHLLLGCVNHLYEHMKAEFPVIAETWAKECHVFRVDVYRGTMGFEGNSSRKLIANVDKLRRLCNKYDVNCLKFVDTFEKFNKVVASCFSKDLKPNYDIFIDNFRDSFLKLNISVTSKIHAIFFHIKHFCEYYGIGLGFFSEQAFESVHHDFKQTWANFKVNSENDNYGSKLLRCVCVYNSKHL